MAHHRMNTQMASARVLPPTYLPKNPIRSLRAHGDDLFNPHEIVCDQTIGTSDC